MSVDDAFNSFVTAWHVLEWQYPDSGTNDPPAHSHSGTTLERMQHSGRQHEAHSRRGGLPA
jgi:hypothetical protein